LLWLQFRVAIAAFFLYLCSFLFEPGENIYRMEIQNMQSLEALVIPTPESKAVSNDTEVYIPEGVCAKSINFKVEDSKLVHVQFTGGCEGNLNAISKLITGMDVERVVEQLEGITCRSKPTSCTDQLTKALREYMKDTTHS
jgi:uncharacterized protein (TIGR03905 family)